MDPVLRAKFQRMREIMRSLERVVVAFSGGVDSVFVLKVAVEALGARNVLAVTGDSPSVPARDREDARRAAESMGVEHLLIDPGDLENPEYLSNPPNRCYHCKDALYERIEPVLAERGLRTIVSGTNADDLGDYRPGRLAAKEHSVREPCAEAGLTKADIRALSAEMGLSAFDKPASPCLSSRVQYGETITPEKLRMIDRAETFLRDEMGMRECRVRHHDRLARIEVPAESIASLAEPENRAKIDAAFRGIGYQYVAIDLRGFRSGSMNEVITCTPGGRRRGRVRDSQQPVVKGKTADRKRRS
ncbi:MAG: ATP-dependent sacrificial sulfur transferase LarE [Phycisphaerae bacterium]|nr:ATP-dependent sacrificial sulfur transferase LarE [Phycisphaerae bacterium]